MSYQGTQRANISNFTNKFDMMKQKQNPTVQMASRNNGQTLTQTTNDRESKLAKTKNLFRRFFKSPNQDYCDRLFKIAKFNQPQDPAIPQIKHGSRLYSSLNGPIKVKAKENNYQSMVL